MKKINVPELITFTVESENTLNQAQVKTFPSVSQAEAPLSGGLRGTPRDAAPLLLSSNRNGAQSPDLNMLHILFVTRTARPRIVPQSIVGIYRLC